MKKSGYSLHPEQALIRQYPWILVNSSWWVWAGITAAPSVTDIALQVGHLSSYSAVRSNMAPAAFDHDACEINCTPTTHQLCLLSFQPVVFFKLEKKKPVNKFAGCQQPTAMLVSCNTVPRTETHLPAPNCKLLSLVNWNYFSLLTSVLAFHLARKLNLRSSSLPVFSLCRKKNGIHTLNPQTSLNPQHPRMNFLSCGAANCIFPPPSLGIYPYN